MAAMQSLGVALLDNGEVSSEPEPPRWFRGRMRGYVLALVAVLAVSPDAVLLRFVRQHSHHSTNCANATAAECNAHMLMVLIFVKYTMMGSIQALFTVWHCGGVRPLVAAVRSSWRPLVVPSTFMLLTQIGFTVSLLETTAANAIMFFSLNPLWAATMGFFCLSDKVERHTLVAMGIAGGAVAFAFIPTVLGSDGGGEDGTAQPEGASGPTLHGNLIALATGVSLAAFITGSRYGSLKDANAPMSAAPALGSLGAALVAAPVALRYLHHLSSKWFLLFIFLDALLEACYDLAMGLAAEHVSTFIVNSNCVSQIMITLLLGFTPLLEACYDLAMGLAAEHVSIFIRNTQHPHTYTTILTYESALGLPTKPVY